MLHTWFPFSVCTFPLNFLKILAGDSLHYSTFTQHCLNIHIFPLQIQSVCMLPFYFWSFNYLQARCINIILRISVDAIWIRAASWLWLLWPEFQEIRAIGVFIITHKRYFMYLHASICFMHCRKLLIICHYMPSYFTQKGWEVLTVKSPFVCTRLFQSCWIQNWIADWKTQIAAFITFIMSCLHRSQILWYESTHSTDPIFRFRFVKCFKSAKSNCICCVLVSSDLVFPCFLCARKFYCMKQEQ